MIDEKAIKQAADVVQAGGIIAYPTESVFGLGCNPDNQQAVKKLLKLKQRDASKGLILIASHVQQILPLIQPIDAFDLARALKTWPGRYTWVFPKTKLVPALISGKFDTVAVRVSNHPIVKALCDKLNKPIVSTSANRSNHAVFNSIKQIKAYFNDKIDFYLDAELGKLGKNAKPSTIVDAHTQEIFR